MAVVKANAYGHGSVAVARHLHTHGVHHFAVATAYEGQELRQAGVMGFIQVFGGFNSRVQLSSRLLSYLFAPAVNQKGGRGHWVSVSWFGLAVVG